MNFLSGSVNHNGFHKEMPEIETASIMSEECGSRETKQNCEFTQGQNVSNEANVNRNRINMNFDKNVGIFQFKNNTLTLDLSAEQTFVGTKTNQLCEFYQMYNMKHQFDRIYFTNNHFDQSSK